MPVSSFGYVNRLKFLPFDAKRYGPPNPYRHLLTIFMVCECPNGHGQLHGLILFKHIFGGAANRADPTVREFIKGCVRGDIAIGIALFGIVNITTN